MNADSIHRRRHTRLIAAVTAALAVGVATAAAEHEDEPEMVEHIWTQVAARQELRRYVMLMPAGWPATEVMRQEADQPLGGAAQRAEWQEMVQQMPSDWPATNAVRAELEVPDQQ